MSEEEKEQQPTTDAPSQPTTAQPAETQPPAAQPAEARPAEAPPSPPAEGAAGMVRCALTGKELPSDQAYWAPPLVTAGELIRTVGVTLVRTPGNLGHVLFENQPDVPYDPEAREQLGARRQAEQLKLLGFLFLILVIIVGIIYLLFF